MEIMRGKQTSFISTAALAERLIGYETVHIDIGTGDGRFVQHMAQTSANSFVIDLEAHVEDLRGQEEATAVYVTRERSG